MKVSGSLGFTMEFIVTTIIFEATLRHHQLRTSAAQRSFVRNKAMLEYHPL